MRNKTNLNAFDNSLYKPGNRFKIIFWYFINILFFKNPIVVFSSIKVLILRFFGSRIGQNVLIKPCVNIKYPWLLEIGNNVWLGEEVWIDNLAKIVIGNNVCISQGAMLLTGNHNYKKKSFDLVIGEIIIEDGVWIGAKSIVCPSITCFSHSILSVNSTATKDLDAYSIYQGTPAIKIRDRIIE